MALFVAKPLILFEENQYNNFEWIGEADDGCLICRWDEEMLFGEESSDKGPDRASGHEGNPLTSLALVTQIAIASQDLQSAQVIYTYNKVVPVIQATANADRTLLGFVIRSEKEKVSRYSAYVAEISPQGGLFSLNIECSRQILLEFLHTHESRKSPEKSWIAKLLVFVHRESISIYSFPLSKKKGKWVVDDQPLTEKVAHSFVWAQWSPSQLHLYYLHHRPPPDRGMSLISEGNEEETLPRLMLTALQFHSNHPHETVLNVPLELSGLEHSPLDLGAAGEYRDQGLLHTLGDPWLDLRVVTSSTGAVCICHHYIYKSRLAETPADLESTSVYLAYSVTLLHHCCVLHAVIPNVPWGRAQTALPTYSLYSDHYLLVLVPGVCIHILDIGLQHFPCNHVVSSACCNQLPPNSQLYEISSGRGCSSRCLNFLDVANQLKIEARVTKESLFNLFKSSPSLVTRLAIMHMTSVHDRDHDLSRKLMWSVCEDLQSLDTETLLREYLVGETFAAVSKHIDSDASHLLSLLPLTTAAFNTDSEYSESHAGESVRISYCMLENACIMLLSPRERLVRGKSDIWTKLWDVTSSKIHQRFSLSQVVEKLMVSLDSYKPEALSQGSTPVSPASPLVGGLTITSLNLTLAHLMFDPLPFNEVENTTSSKLEHLLSVNLRELSMHCLKHFSHESPMRVHAVASKYVCTQLQVSRRLCSIICSSQTLIPTEKSEKGFSFIEQLDPSVAWRLFMLIERYHLATEIVAFPLPQGYNSFFAYLAFRCLSHEQLICYVKRGVLQLNVDVLREIIYDLDDSPTNVERKLEIASCVPLVRCLRALQYWHHPMSLVLRSRLHAASILAGEGPGYPKSHFNRMAAIRHPEKKPTSFGNSAFPTTDRISPFDSFLELLTAKARLSDLDLDLLHEGTISALTLGREALTDEEIESTK